MKIQFKVFSNYIDIKSNRKYLYRIDYLFRCYSKYDPYVKYLKFERYSYYICG